MSFSSLFSSTSGMMFLIVTLKPLWKKEVLNLDHSSLNRWVINYSSSLALEAKKLNVPLLRLGEWMKPISKVT
jgi:hypothetical protein